jgi:ribosomal protein L7Ae-like RNA K-turn-binding protein
MIRIVRGPGGEAVFDLEGRLPGRGVYLCPAADCLGNLAAPALSRALKAETSVPGVEDRRALLGRQLEEKVKNLLSIGSKAGRTASGAQVVREALQKGRVELLLLAGDASTRTTGAFRTLAGEVPCRRAADRKKLGRWFGRDSVAVAAVLHRGLARPLLTALDRLTAIEYSPYYVN